MSGGQAEAKGIVLTDGPQLRGARVPTVCPRCQAPADRRVLSAGFGDPHDLCGVCGYEFAERTV